MLSKVCFTVHTSTLVPLHNSRIIHLQVHTRSHQAYAIYNIQYATCNMHAICAAHLGELPLRIRPLLLCDFAIRVQAQLLHQTHVGRIYITTAVHIITRVQLVQPGKRISHIALSGVKCLLFHRFASVQTADVHRRVLRRLTSFCPRVTCGQFEPLRRVCNE